MYELQNIVIQGGDHPLSDAGGRDQRPRLRLREQEEGVRKIQVSQDLLLHAGSGEIYFSHFYQKVSRKLIH